MLTPKNVQGAPALVIEILSPSTRARDLQIKRRLFDRGGVREYWIVDPDLNQLQVHRRNATGALTLVAQLETQCRRHSVDADSAGVSIAARSAVPLTTFSGSISDLQERLAAQHYVADRGLAVSVFLALRLGRPLFLEGEAGVGKTSLAGAVAQALGADLIRLQCYEGLDINHAVYEWDYARQLLELRILDAAGDLNRDAARRELYSEAFLIKRPLLQAIDPKRSHPAVLLIDEIDRADEEFEGYLLELLAEFQFTIPEIGTVRAKEPPLVILTSNRTREVHDALKRRCLYQWIEYPSFDKETAIVRERVPGASERLAAAGHRRGAGAARGRALQGAGRLRDARLGRGAGGARSSRARSRPRSKTRIGVVLKSKDDLDALRGERLAALLARVPAVHRV